MSCNGSSSYQQNRPPPPTLQQLDYIGDENRRAGEKEKRERAWRRAATDSYPIKLDQYDDQNSHSLACALCRPTVNSKASDELVKTASEVRKAIQAFVCDISPSDRELFWTVREAIVGRDISTEEGRKKIDALIHRTSWKDATVAERLYNKKLLSYQDASHITDAQMRIDRLRLEEKGKMGQMPGHNNSEVMNEKTKMEAEEMRKGQKAQESRSNRRKKAIEDYDRLWERINREGKFSIPSSSSTWESKHPNAALVDDKARERFRNLLHEGPKKRDENQERKPIDPMAGLEKLNQYGSQRTGFSATRFGPNITKDRVRRRKERSPSLSSSDEEPPGVPGVPPRPKGPVRELRGLFDQMSSMFGYKGTDYDAKLKKKPDSSSKESGSKKIAPEMFPGWGKDVNEGMADLNKILNVLESRFPDTTEPTQVDDNRDDDVDVHSFHDDGESFHDDVQDISDDREETHHREETTGVEEKFGGLGVKDTAPPVVPSSIASTSTPSVIPLSISTSTVPTPVIPPSTLPPTVIPPPTISTVPPVIPPSTLSISIPPPSTLPPLTISTSPPRPSDEVMEIDEVEIDVVGMSPEEPKKDFPGPSSTIVAPPGEGIGLTELGELALAGASSAPTAKSVSKTRPVPIDKFKAPVVHLHHDVEFPNRPPPPTADKKDDKEQDSRRKKKKKLPKTDDGPPMDDSEAAHLLLLFQSAGSSADSSPVHSPTTLTRPPPPSTSTPLQPSPLTTRPVPPSIQSTSSTVPSASTSSKPATKGKPGRPKKAESAPSVGQVQTPTSKSITPTGPSRVSRAVPSTPSGVQPSIPQFTSDKDNALNHETLMSYESPADSAGGKKLAALKEKMEKSSLLKDKSMYDAEKRAQKCLNYALYIWPKSKFPIKGLVPQELAEMSRDQVMEYLQTGPVEPGKEVTGQFTLVKLNQLYTNYLSKTGELEKIKFVPASKVDPKLLKDVTSKPSKSRAPQKAKKTPAVAIEKKPFEKTAAGKRASDHDYTVADEMEETPEEAAKETPPTPAEPMEREPSPVHVGGILTETAEMLDESALESLVLDDTPKQKPTPVKTGEVLASTPLQSPIPTESTERPGQRTRGSSEESERKRKISEEDSSEGEPEMKKRESKEKELAPPAAPLEELMEADEQSRNDGEEGLEMEETVEKTATNPSISPSQGGIDPIEGANRPTANPSISPSRGTEDQPIDTPAIITIPIDQSIPIDITDNTNPIDESQLNQSQPIEIAAEQHNDGRSLIEVSEDEEIDPEECMIIDTVENSTHVMRERDSEPKSEVRESTAQVLGIVMGPLIVQGVPDSPTGSTATNEFEAPDLNLLAYLRPNRDVSMISEVDDKDDKNLVAARIEEERLRVGISENEGEVTGVRVGVQRKVPQLKETSYKLLVYLLKQRFDDDLLPSQRNLRHFADIIQNKLISPLQVENPTEWSHQFYKVRTTELITKTLYEPPPNSLERDMLLLTPSDQFTNWRNGRALTSELLEIAVRADDTPFKALIEKALKLKDSFTIVRARAIYRKLLTDISTALDDLKMGDEDGNKDYEAIEEELTERVKEIFIFSFYVVSNSISINNRSRTALRPYELLRVMAYVLDGWTGWLERGGIYRLFIAFCEKREREGGYVPLGKERAAKRRDRIESRVSSICGPLQTIEYEEEERLVIYMLNQLKNKEIHLATARDIKEKRRDGRTIKCEQDLGNARNKCSLLFKTEEEKTAHREIAHLWRDRDNSAASKCHKCTRWFLMDCSLIYHQLIAHYDYDEEEEEEEGEEGGSDGGSSPRDDGGDGGDDDDGDGDEKESDKKKIKKLSMKTKRQYSLAISHWDPEFRDIKMEEESPKKNTSMKE